MEKRARKSAAYRAALEEQKPYEHFARLVIRKRMQLGLTQEELAKRMGTSHSVISRLESGQHRFSFATMRKLAKALDTHLVYGFQDEAPTRSPAARRSASWSSLPDGPAPAARVASDWRTDWRTSRPVDFRSVAPPQNKTPDFAGAFRCG